MFERYILENPAQLSTTDRPPPTRRRTGKPRTIMMPQAPWVGTGVFSPPQAEPFWALVVNGTGSHRQFFCSRCDGMGRDNLRLDGTGTGREMSHAF